MCLAATKQRRPPTTIVGSRRICRRVLSLGYYVFLLFLGLFFVLLLMFIYNLIDYVCTASVQHHHHQHSTPCRSTCQWLSRRQGMAMTKDRAWDTYMTVCSFLFFISYLFLTSSSSLGTRRLPRRWWDDDVRQGAGHETCMRLEPPRYVHSFLFIFLTFWSLLSTGRLNIQQRGWRRWRKQARMVSGAVRTISK